MLSKKKLPYFTFSDEEMLKYLNEMDPFLLKYGLTDLVVENEDKKRELLNRIHCYEETFGPMAVRDDDAGKTHDTLKLIYGMAEPIDLFSTVVQQVRDKIITRLFSAEGLANLFNCKYFSYEWLMHMEIYDNNEKPEFNHYRDHFIHQVKDAYSMVRLLEEVPSLQENLLYDFMHSNVNVNTYLNKQANAMACGLEHNRELLQIYMRLAELRWQNEEKGKVSKEDLQTAEQLIDDLERGAFPPRNGNAYKVPKTDLQTAEQLETGASPPRNGDAYKVPKTDLQTAEQLEIGASPPRNSDAYKVYTDLMQYVKKDILRVIMLEAMLMAGLFHDIGYPIAYTLRNKENLSEMVPTAHFFIESLDHFTEINGMLSGSLLFRIVDSQAIKAAVKDQNHGALSALAFLLYFYENGAIHRMDALDGAAIEVASLMIFDHTLRYTIIDDKPAAYRYHRAVYYRNPMSYLLRFVDDIQEWGRVYFNIRTNRSLRICQTCRMPIVECKLASGSNTVPLRNMLDIWKSSSDDGRFSGLSEQIYLCGCDDDKVNTIAKLWEDKQNSAEKAETSSDNTFFLLQDIAYRKINHIKYCHRIHFLRVGTEDYDPSNFLFLPNYADDLTDDIPRLTGQSAKNSPERLLLHIEYDPFKMLQMTMMDPSFSRYRSSELNKVRKLLRNQTHFLNIGVYALTTNNPLILKVRMLENFLNDWYAKFAKAEALYNRLSELAQENSSSDAFERRCENSLMRFCLRKEKMGKPDFGSLMDNLLPLCAGVLNWLKLATGEKGSLASHLDYRYEGENSKIKDAAATNLLLRIFMLLSENPRWMIGDVEHIPIATAVEPEQMFSELCEEYDNLIQLMKTRRYETHRIRLETKENFIALLELVYTMRYRCNNPEKLKNYIETGEDAKEGKRLFSLDRVTNNASYIRLRNCLCDQIANGTSDSLGLEHENCHLAEQRRDKMANHLDFYAKLLYTAKYCCALGVRNVKKDIKMKEYYNKIMEDKLVVNFHRHAAFGSSLRELLDDYFLQECGHPHYHYCTKGFDNYPQSYYNTYKISNELINSVACYCRSENYVSRKIASPSADMLDLYSDLYMFFCISYIWSEAR